MKNSSLTILLLISVHFLFAQNVKIIPASEKPGKVNNAIIIPAPSPSKTVHNKPATGVKVNPSSPSNTSLQKKNDVKSVRGASEKKPCVEKFNPSKKNPSAPTKEKSPQSGKK